MRYRTEVGVRADRLLALVLLLQARGRMTAAALAREGEVSERTILRDLSALSGAGIPLVARPGPGGGWSLLEGYRTTLTGLTTPELRALFAAAQTAPLGELGLRAVLDDVVLKLLAALPPVRRPDAELARQRLHVDPQPWYRTTDETPYLRLLQDAVWQDRLVLLRYQRAHDVVERRVEPYGLVAKADVWYLVANVEAELRTYRVSRIADVARLDESFVREPNFDLAAYWTRSNDEFRANLPRYPVTVRAAPEVLDRLRRGTRYRDHDTAATSEPPGADGWTTLHLAFDVHEEALATLLFVGASIEVLAPTKLRDALADVATRLLARHQAPAS
jgi:predicted DNA-binding transcriptional regulator YafY